MDNSLHECFELVRNLQQKAKEMLQEKHRLSPKWAPSGMTARLEKLQDNLNTLQDDWLQMGQNVPESPASSPKLSDPAQLDPSCFAG
jgi:hypothetical protein